MFFAHARRVKHLKMNLRETGGGTVEVINLTDFCENDYKPEC
jgi:hypothetical protein